MRTASFVTTRRWGGSIRRDRPKTARFGAHARLMLRPLLAILCALLPLSAAAQTTPSAPDVAQATRALSAMWRPLAGAASVEAACAGAIEEIEAVEAALPPVVTQESLARVRALRGLLIVPTDDPQAAYFFPDRSMPWFTSGMGAIAVIDETEGFIGVRDAGGSEIAIQLGRGGEHALLRIRNPEGQVLNFVGCAPTWRS